jgi:hypothetical protein
MYIGASSLEVILLLALVFADLGIFGFLPQSKSREGSPDRLTSRTVTDTLSASPVDTHAVPVRDRRPGNP